jgi:hypothetical protein
MGSALMADTDSSTFRALVDEAEAERPLAGAEDAIRLFDSDLQEVQPSRRPEALRTLIAALLGSDATGDAARPFVMRLRKSVKFEQVLGLRAEPYSELLRIIGSALPMSRIRPFSDREDWVQAIQRARAVRLLEKAVPELPGREEAVLEAARRLAARGTRFRVEGGALVLEPPEIGKVAASIERRVVAMGGLEVLSQVLRIVRETAPEVDGRYVPGRSFSLQLRPPSFPAGYLLQLGAKHLAAPPAKPALASVLWKKIVAEATDLCSVLDIEPYTNMDGMFVDPSELPAYLASVALFDHLFALKQWPPSRTLELLEGVTSGLDREEARQRVGWSLDEAFQLVGALLAVARRPMTLVTPADLYSSGLGRDAWARLRPAFVQALGRTNLLYSTPLDAHLAEFDFKPLWELPNERYLIVSPGLAALASFEAVTRALRNAGYPKLDQKMGDAVEQVVADALRGAGQEVTVQSRKYFAPGIVSGKDRFESDLVVETDELILLIELKKKPLRRVSATGKAASALVDLANSLFEAQEQLGRHEQLLLRDGSIRFANGYVLERRDRRIERIAMTWLDFGGLQDKYLLSQIFEGLAGRRLSSDDPDTDLELQKLNRAIAKLEAQMTELLRLGKEQRLLFMNCWFLSVPQLLMILDNLQRPEDLARHVGKLRHLSYRTLDFYRDYAFALRQGLLE